MTTYNLDIIDVINAQIIEKKELIKEENYYLRNSNEKGQVRFDQIRLWKDNISELEVLKRNIFRLRNKNVLPKAHDLSLDEQICELQMKKKREAIK